MKLLKSYRIFFLSIAMAFFLWFYVRLSSSYRQEIEIPMKVVNLREGYALTSEDPIKIRVLVDADGRTLLGMRFFYDAYFLWDMKLTQERALVVPSQHPENIVFPDKANARVVGVVTSDSIWLKSERLVSKKLRITPRVEVACAPGFVAVGPVSVVPDSVKVSVPASLSDSFLTIATPVYAVRDLETDLEITMTIEPPDSRVVRFEAVEVQVHVDVQPLGETVIENLPIHLINVPADVRAVVQPSTFSLKVQGGVDFLANVSRDSILGIIDYEKESQFQFPQPRLIIQAPRDLRWTQITPSRFNLVRLADEAN